MKISKVKQALTLMFSAALLTAVGCTSYTLEEDKAQLISLSKSPNSDLIQYAPLIKLFDSQEDFNKIGTPKVHADGSIYVDSNEANFYTTEQVFKIEDREYTNLIYRVHFSEIPFSLVPFHLSKGKNVGLIFVVSLNQKKEPILFTAVHSCGCYMATMATSFTPESFYPDKWSKDPQTVYGEQLPSVLQLSESQPDICVALRPHTHRVMDIYPCDKSQNNYVEAPHKTLSSLRRLPTENGTTSFFHEEGIQEGLVKGAIKPWETLLLSWASLDLFVGTDKALLRPDSSDNTFYTSIKPWNHGKSDMANFPQFLEFWGWKL